MSENGSTPEPVPEPAPATPPLTPEAFAAEMDVSRETLDRLEIYVDTLRDWQSRKNLVGAASLADVWRRHILDSAQLFPFLAEDAELVDTGRGAGFPGLVVPVLVLENIRHGES